MARNSSLDLPLFFHVDAKRRHGKGLKRVYIRLSRIIVFVSGYFAVTFLVFLVGCSEFSIDRKRVMSRFEIPSVCPGYF